MKHNASDKIGNETRRGASLIARGWCGCGGAERGTDKPRARFTGVVRDKVLLRPAWFTEIALFRASHVSVEFGRGSTLSSAGVVQEVARGLKTFEGRLRRVVSFSSRVSSIFGTCWVLRRCISGCSSPGSSEEIGIWGGGNKNGNSWGIGKICTQIKFLRRW